MLFKDVFKLFYPDFCLNCKADLFFNERILCSSCRHDLPLLQLSDFKKNEVTSVFYGRIRIEKAVSFLYFRKEGVTKKLIHHLKYKNNQRVGVFLGDWFGTVLKNSNQFNDANFIVPVPLHSSKFKKRGYNQVTTFSESLSRILKVPIEINNLERILAEKTQTNKKRFDRFSNINTKFNLIDTSLFENKHILLVDDVITTGATLEACCKELKRTKDITISIVTIAFTSKK